MYNSPLIVLSLVIVTLHSAAFHLLWGKTLKNLLVYWAAALLGFAAGQLLASALSWRDVLLIGKLHLLVASAASCLLMALAKRVKL